MIIREDDYIVQVHDITSMYNEYKENGASLIDLVYDDENEELSIGVKCCDDSEPYYNYSDELKCSLKNFTVILMYIVNGYLHDEYTGVKYPVHVTWDWY